MKSKGFQLIKKIKFHLQLIFNNFLHKNTIKKISVILLKYITEVTRKEKKEKNTII